MSVCTLCLQPRPLSESHVWPEWGYERLYENGQHRFYRLSSAPGERVTYEYKGLREPLLCRPPANLAEPLHYFACETKLSKYERYAQHVLRDPGRIVLPTATTDTVSNHAHYQRFRIFQLSLLWRAHLASDPFFRAVNLGPKHAERLRSLIAAEDPGSPDEYPCALLAANFEGRLLREFSLPPQGRRESGHREYALFFDGFVWMFLVASHRPDDAIAHAAIQPDGTFAIGYYDVLKSPEWVQAVREIALRNRPGIERLRTKRKETPATTCPTASAKT